MSESEKSPDDQKSGGTHRRPRLMERTMRERWAIPRSLRRPLVERLSKIVRDPEAPHRELLSAASVILMASKINLANIALAIKVQKHKELEEHACLRSSVRSTRRLGNKGCAVDVRTKPLRELGGHFRPGERRPPRACSTRRPVAQPAM